MSLLNKNSLKMDEKRNAIEISRRLWTIKMKKYVVCYKNVFPFLYDAEVKNKRVPKGYAN